MDFLLSGSELICVVPGRSLPIDILRSESLERGLIPFEVVEARGAKCFKLEEHLLRLWESIVACGLHHHFVQRVLLRDLAGHIGNVLSIVGFAESVVRISIIADTEGKLSPAAILISVNLSTRPNQPLALLTVPYVRNFPELKLGGTYAHAQIMLRLHKGYDDILYFHPYLNVVTEASRANFFAVIGTPEHRFLYGAKKSSLILPGITRRTLLDIISDKREAGIFSGELPYDRLSQVTEAFIASTTKRIMPVYQIDGRYLPVGEDRYGGPVTRMFRVWFDEYAEAYYGQK